MIFARKRRRSGVALIISFITIAILAVMYAEMLYTARIRMVTAYNERDRTQAYWLAKSGVNIYSLVLTANKQIGKNSFIQDLGLGDNLWQLLPGINTHLLRELMNAGAGGLSKEEAEEFKKTGKASEAAEEESREGGVFADRNFLDFSGNFAAMVTDNEGKIDLNQLASENGLLRESPTAQRIFALMDGEVEQEWYRENINENLDTRWDLIGNIRDWVDQDDLISSGLGGREDSLYDRLDPPYYTKNAKFDSLKELRLVKGWENDKLYKRYADKFTVWSNGKYNLNSFDEQMHKAMIRATAITPVNDALLDICMNSTGPGGTGDSVLSAWDVANFSNANSYVSFIKSTCNIELDKSKIRNVTSTSKVFTITSTGDLPSFNDNMNEITITAVIDYSRRSTGQIRYWRIE